VLYEISKESLPKKPTKNIADKKIWFSNRQSFFEEVAQDMGLIPNKSGLDIGFERHPMYLVEAADDICYTIIDFEDGMNWVWKILL
jgi:dGTPase